MRSDIWLARLILPRSYTRGAMRMRVLTRSARRWNKSSQAAKSTSFRGKRSSSASGRQRTKQPVSKRSLPRGPFSCRARQSRTSMSLGTVELSNAGPVGPARRSQTVFATNGVVRLNREPVSSTANNTAKRLLLFTAKLGYQTRSFEEAARKLGVQLVYVTDRCHEL